ncbi:hypothetical protein MGWOODY_Tha1951 [hydrothermal vent metagenome]|uniref:Uncharacterized protein n=1 Tax=hydrothermal vent metagenome TaxID=652676 RepID=A0A160TBA7_9ZZZZ
MVRLFEVRIGAAIHSSHQKPSFKSFNYLPSPLKSINKTPTTY